MYKSTGWRRLLLLLLLILTMGLQICPMATQAEETSVQLAAQEDLLTVVESQVRAYADSIDQSNADYKAAADLAGHGLAGGGKKMTMGASSSLTATLLNSELFQKGFSTILSNAIRNVHRMDMKSVPTMRMSFNWYDTKYSYTATVLTDTGEYPDSLNWTLINEKYTGQVNAYDSSLIWMVGSSAGDIAVQCIEDNGSERVYKVTVNIKDRFDFSTANASGFDKLLNSFAMKLFREFDWSCTATMNITVPYSCINCNHSSGAYHWTYDAENQAMLSDGSGTWLQNNATHYTNTTTNGTVHHYFELDNTIRLYHNKTWVLEYDVSKPSRITLAPVNNAVTKIYPQIAQTSRTSVYVVTRDYLMAQAADGTMKRFHAYNYCGVKIGEQYKFSSAKTYTFRLENEVSEDGSNRIYLTAINTQTGECCLDRIPMDDFYYHGGWMEDTPLLDDESTWLSGKDIYINYIGTRTAGFKAGTFDLRIWENGIENPHGSCWSEVQHAATCTEVGYILRTCSRCGCSEKVEVPALGHDYETAVVSPTCTEQGYTSHTCVRCGDRHTDGYTDPQGHSYENAICAVCGTHRPGDINGDGNVNNKDATYLFQYLSGWDAEVVEETLDVNGDGAVNNKDATYLFQYLSGWNVEIK